MSRVRISVRVVFRVPRVRPTLVECPMRVCILSLLALLAVPPATAAQTRWVTIGKGGGQRIEVDTADVGLTSSLHITLWWRASYSSPRSSSLPGSSLTLHWSSFTEREEIDCHAGETRMVQETLYNATGGVVSVLKSDSLASWDTPTPDSIIEAVMHWACKHL